MAGAVSLQQPTVPISTMSACRNVIMLTEGKGDSVHINSLMPSVLSACAVADLSLLPAWLTVQTAAATARAFRQASSCSTWALCAAAACSDSRAGSKAGQLCRAVPAMAPLLAPCRV